MQTGGPCFSPDYIFRVKELKGEGEVYEDEEEEEDEDLLDQEFPPDNFGEFVSEDEGGGGALDHLVRLHKQSIKHSEALLKREKDLLVTFATGQDDESSLQAYLAGLSDLCEERKERALELEAAVAEAAKK